MYFWIEVKCNEPTRHDSFNVPREHSVQHRVNKQHINWRPQIESTFVVRITRFEHVVPLWPNLLPLPIANLPDAPAECALRKYALQQILQVTIIIMTVG